MRSTKSFSKNRGLHAWFNPTLYRKNMARFWPIWAGYAAVLFFYLPIQLLTNYTPDRSLSVYFDQSATATAVKMSGPDYFARVFVPQGVEGTAWIFGLLIGILATMAVFSYLFQSRSVGLMHALPIRRESLFLTNYLSGLSFFALPLILIFFVTLIAEAFMGAVFFPALFSWLVAELLTAFFFYSFAVFCAMFTGHILALPVFYAILNGLAYGLCGIVTVSLQEFVFGYGSDGSGLNGLLQWLTPVLNLRQALGTEPVGNSYCITGFLTVFVYTLVGILLTVCAMVLYHKRHLESAGDVVSVPWVRPVFKYGVSICMALALGMFLYSIFRHEHSSPLLFLICAILSGAAGYYVADMLLRKSFHVFRRNWKGPLAVTGVLVVGILCMVFDVTGYEQRIPSPDQVSSVIIYSLRSAPDDDGRFFSLSADTPEDKAIISKLHAALISERTDISTRSYSSYDDYAVQKVSGVPLEIQNTSYQQFNLKYVLANGRVMSRSYAVQVDTARLSDPNSAAYLLNQLMNRPDQVENAYFEWVSNQREDGIAMRLSDVTISLQKTDENGEPYTMETALGMDQAGREALLAAIHADIAAGDLGRRYLLENEERYTNCYYNDISLTFYAPSLKERYPDANSYHSIIITLQASAGNTLRVLEQYGLAPNALTPLAEYYGKNGSDVEEYATARYS